MSGVFEQMLSRYDTSTSVSLRNATFEVMQQVAMPSILPPELFREKLVERLSSVDIEMVKNDVRPFVRNPRELDIWSTDYFIALAGMVEFL